MKNSLISIVSAASFAILASNPAMASSDQQSLELCRAALSADVANTSKLKFKSIRGASKKTVTFEVMTSTGRQMVSCSVRRGAVVGTNWVDGNI